MNTVPGLQWVNVENLLMRNAHQLLVLNISLLTLFVVPFTCRPRLQLKKKLKN